MSNWTSKHFFSKKWASWCAKNHFQATNVADPAMPDHSCGMEPFSLSISGHPEKRSWHSWHNAQQQILNSQATSSCWYGANYHLHCFSSIWNDGCSLWVHHQLCRKCNLHLSSRSSFDISSLKFAVPSTGRSVVLALCSTRNWRRCAPSRSNEKVKEVERKATAST